MTATEDRMREAFDAEHHIGVGLTLVQIAASVAEDMVDEATAALRKQHAEMLAALKALVDAHDYFYLNRGIGTETPQGQRWLKARAAIAAAEASGTGG